MAMVKGTTKSGIKFQIDDRIKDDARFLYYMTKVQDSDAGPEEQGKAVIGVLKLVFGTEEGVINFMNAVANVHDGVCGAKEMMSEWTEMMEALNVKN